MSEVNPASASKGPSFLGGLKEKMIGTTDAQILLGVAVSNVALGFAVPFLLQAGMGSSLESAAIRGGLLGLTNGVVSLAAYGTAVSYAESTAAAMSMYAGSAAVITPVINTIAYGVGQQVIGLRGQGAMKDVTFAFVSSSAIAGGTVAATVGVSLLMSLKSSSKK